MELSPTKHLRMVWEEDGQVLKVFWRKNNWERRLNKNRVKVGLDCRKGMRCGRCINEKGEDCSKGPGRKKPMGGSGK